MKKKLNYKRIIIVLIIILILFKVYNVINAKYKSNGQSNNKIDIAYYVVDGGIQSQEIMLSGISPSNELYEYPILVTNTKDGKTAETAMTYTISIKTTTNLPLKYNLYLSNEYDKKGIAAEKQNISQEIVKPYGEDGIVYKEIKTDFKEMGISEQKDIYTLVVEFPEKYKTNIEYANILEVLEVTIDSKQKI